MDLNPSHTHTNQKPIAIWLLVCCAMVFAMIVLGGVTRLTGSGLSMVEWDPIMGILPPLNQAQWQETFLLYQQFPEYIQKNAGMSLDEFKSIFWFEYAHRVLGRSIGIVFLLPFLFFLITRRVDRALSPKLIAMFVLGGLQGLLGWYMVKSGLINEPHVSQYRLTAHLGLAVAIYFYMFWVALDLLYPTTDERTKYANRKLTGFSLLVSFSIFFTILSGGFVAGTRAGFAYNTFPLMGGQWIPDGLLSLSPAWRNFFENVTTVQFDHRVLAMLLCAMVFVLWGVLARSEQVPRVRTGGHLLLAAMAMQIALGISTLLLHVPVTLATAHQAGAIVLFTASVFLSHQLRGRTTGKLR